MVYYKFQFLLFKRLFKRHKKLFVFFWIFPTMYEAEYQKALAEVKASEIELQNTKDLANKNVVSKNELAVAKAKLDQARAEMTMAKFHLFATDIRAPFSGTIDRLPKKLGSLIDEGELLTSLSDNIQMYDYLEVLLTQRDALETKLELIETKKDQLNAVVNVYKDLGGGWR